MSRKEKCQSCIIDFKLKCFDCELVVSCRKCLKSITQNKVYSTETNKLQRLAPNENDNVAPHYYGKVNDQNKGVKKIQVFQRKCSKYFIEMNHND